MGRRVTDSGIAPAASWRGPTALRGSDAPARRTVSTRLLNSPVSAIVAALATASFGASGAAAFAATPTAPGAASLPATGPGASPSSTAPAPLACLASGNNGYLRARLRGTFDLDLAWSSPTMQCEGGARPDGRGLRVTIAGPAADGRRLRFVFGIDDTPEGASVRARPTNLTVIFEGEQRLAGSDPPDHRQALRRTARLADDAYASRGTGQELDHAFARQRAQMFLSRIGGTETECHRDLLTSWRHTGVLHGVAYKREDFRLARR